MIVVIEMLPCRHNECCYCLIEIMNYFCCLAGLLNYILIVARAISFMIDFFYSIFFNFKKLKMEGQPPLKKKKNLFSFFQRKDRPTESTTSDGLTQDQPSFPPEIEQHSSSNISIEREPGKRKQILEFPCNLRDEIRVAYLKAGPYQPKLVEYPKTQGKSQSRRFQEKWFNQFLWLEYSPIKDRAYCFYCYLFRNHGNPSNCSALVTSGYNQWKRVNDGLKCVFLTHLRSSDHNMCERRAKDLMKPSQHIDKVMHTVSNSEVEKRRLRLKTSIRSARWLAFQSCSSEVMMNLHRH
jgi:hypothetical protein